MIWLSIRQTQFGADSTFSTYSRLIDLPGAAVGFRLSKVSRVTDCLHLRFAVKKIKGIMAKMRAAQITRPGGAFEIVEREIPSPWAGQLRIKVQACGNIHVCPGMKWLELWMP